MSALCLELKGELEQNLWTASHQLCLTQLPSSSCHAKIKPGFPNSRDKTRM